MQVGYTEGQNIKQSEFLAQIDPRPFQAALKQAQGTLAHDTALLEEAQIDLQRYETLVKQDSIAQQQYDAQKALVHQYEGTIKTDEAAVDTARLNLNYSHITSPVTGRVGLRLVDPGNYVQTSDSGGVAVITQIDPISVIFTVPEDNVPQIMQRMQSGDALEVIAFDRSGSKQLAVGKLLTIDNQIDTSTGTVKLRALFDNKDYQLFPNQFVNARLLIDTLHDAVIVPSSSILRGAPGIYVYVVKPDDNTVTVRTVSLGPSQGEQQAIVAGLEPGDLVVTDGSDKLREGAKVSLPGSDAGADAGGKKEHGDGKGGKKEHHKKSADTP
ncbi:MAG: efflux transporter, family, subunit, partial [Nevskia sp.]|nr:efflux transporter, family, subunit [Nevskia sp.]